METLRNIEIPQLSSLLTLTRFHTCLGVSLLKLGKCCRLRLTAVIKAQTSKNTKHVITSTNYAILTKRVKVQHEKKSKYIECRFLANLQNLEKILRFSFRKNNFFIGKRPVAETISVAINGSSDVLYFVLYLINIFEKSTKAERCTDKLSLRTLLFIWYC